MLVAPPPALCTDNGAMIAWAGIERLARGMTDTLEAAPRARWPLDGDGLPRRDETKTAAPAAPRPEKSAVAAGEGGHLEG